MFSNISIVLIQVGVVPRYKNLNSFEFIQLIFIAAMMTILTWRRQLLSPHFNLNPQKRQCLESIYLVPRVKFSKKLDYIHFALEVSLTESMHSLSNVRLVSTLSLGLCHYLDVHKYILINTCVYIHTHACIYTCMDM